MALRFPGASCGVLLCAAANGEGATAGAVRRPGDPEDAQRLRGHAVAARAFGGCDRTAVVELVLMGAHTDIRAMRSRWSPRE